MSLIVKRLIAALLAVIGVSTPARASGPGDAPKLTSHRTFKKLRTNEERAPFVVQRTSTLELRNRDTKTATKGMSEIYHVERVEGDQILLWDSHCSVRGWVSQSSVVSLNDAPAYFSEQIRADPTDAFALWMRGVAGRGAGNLDQALADVTESIRLAPSFIQALITRAYIWQEKNRPEQAMVDANVAIGLDHRSSAAFLARAFLYCDARQFEKALRDFEQAIALGSRAVAIHSTRGFIYLEMKELEKANAEFQHALLIEPNRPDVYLGIGTLQSLQSHYEESLSAYKKAIELDPHNADPHGARATIFLILGEKKKALAELNEAIRLDSTCASRLRTRGTLRFDNGDFKHALTDLESAIRFAPNDADAHAIRAWVLATCPDSRIRDGAVAVVAATRACELTGWREPRSIQTLAAAHAETGDFESAINWQQRAIDLLAANDVNKYEYRKLLERYKTKKPCRRLAFLEEIGFRGPRHAASQGE
jgi:tetratricopeptide (TPR) repeat protein